jgi:succinate dehydrogenase/fumarate reductase cytochrome b subunit
MLDQVDVAFVVEFAGLSFLFLALYVIIARTIASLLMRGRMNETVRECMKRFLMKAPIVVTMIGFTAGLCGYIGLIVMDTLQHFNKYDDASDVNYKRKVLLVVFTVSGICYGAISGLALFYKRCKAMNSSASTERGRDA